MRVLLSASVTTFLATAMVVAPAVLPTNIATVVSASADACPNVQIVFARGTDEDQGVGHVGQAFVDAFRAHASKTQSIAVPGSTTRPRTTSSPPPPEPTTPAASFRTSPSPAPKPKSFLVGLSGRCGDRHPRRRGRPNPAFTDPLPAAVADHVAAVAVIGNPSNRIKGPLTTLSPLYGSKTIDLCNGADPGAHPATTWPLAASTSSPAWPTRRPPWRPT